MNGVSNFFGSYLFEKIASTQNMFYQYVPVYTY